MVNIGDKTDSTPPVHSSPTSGTTPECETTAATASPQSLHARLLVKLPVIRLVQLGLSLLVVVLLLGHLTQWGNNYLSTGLLVAAAVAALVGIAAVLGGQLLLAPHYAQLERIHTYMQDFSDPDTIEQALKEMPPFPVGASVSEASKGWNNLLAAIDLLRTQQRIDDARDGMSQQISSYDAQRLQAVLNSLPDGIVVADAEGVIILTNRACQGELGRSLADMVGCSVLDLFGDDAAKESLKEMLNPRGIRNEVAFEVLLDQRSGTANRPAGQGPTEQGTHDEPLQNSAGGPQRSSGHDIETPTTTLWVRCYRVNNGRENSDIILALRDITQHKVAEAAQEAFIAHVGHEFRSPLTNIRAYAETLLSDMELDVATQKEAFNVINEETARLVLMVNDVLDLSRMESGSLKLKRDNVVLDRLIPQCVNDVQAMASSKRITLQSNYHPKMPNIYADREKIAVVLNNILSNAIKYTGETGTVFVETNVDDNFVYIKVSDTGIGIAAADLDHIFEKFYRVDRKETAEIPGTGLGLAITKEIVALHGGGINVTSEMNKGTEVAIKLPLTVKNPTLGLATSN